MSRTPSVVADVDFGNTTPWCSHCENVFPLHAKVDWDGDVLLVQCLSCSHISAFKKANNRTPIDVYDAELPIKKRRLVDIAEVAELFWDRQKRIVREGGTVELNNARYEPADPESFAALACEIKRDVLVACDPYNIGEAIALTPDGRFLGRLRAQALLIHAQAGRRAEPDQAAPGSKGGERMSRTPSVVADVDFGNTTPWCSHCENVFPLHAKVDWDGDVLLVQCLSCSHISAFKKAVSA